MNITPVITENTMTFAWNVQDIKRQLAERLEKYNGLVVTEENYEDMSKAKREIVTFRTTINAFGNEQKRALKEPYNKFASELKDVLLEVERVEKPLAEQLKYFDEKQEREKQAKIETIVAEKIALYGLREEYHQFIDRDSRWWRNKTFKISDATVAIEEQIKSLSQRQQADDDMKKIQEEKRGMLEFAFDMFSAQYELVTPLEFESIYHQVQNMPINQAKQVMQAEFDSRLELEQAAKEQKMQVEEQESQVKESVLEPSYEQPEKEKTYLVIAKGLTQKELRKLEGFLSINGIEYEVK